MRILAIDTSCDDTAVALVEEKEGKFFIVEELLSSQTKTHSPFGGVVPNLAARDHLKNLPLLLKKIISKNITGREAVDLIAVTEGPGLIPALLIGTNAAKALAYAWQKPLVGVNHVEGHIYANFIGKVKSPAESEARQRRQKSKVRNLEVKFPILALIVSGGHTELIFMEKHMRYKAVGHTLDDAAGEAFDKVAKILNLGYPGGPIVAAEAAKFKKNTKYQILDTKYPLPRPMINSNNFDFSFSGLKTAVLYTVRDNPKILKSRKLKAELCAEFQQAVIDVLLHKTIKAAKKYQPKTILLGGGVSANEELRSQLGNAINRNLRNIPLRGTTRRVAKYLIPDTRHSLDNAAMIAVAGYYNYQTAKDKKIFLTNWKNLEAEANLSLT